MSFNKIEQTLEIFHILSRGLGFTDQTNGFMIANKNCDITLLNREDTLTPVLTGMSDVLYKTLFPENDFKGLFPTHIVKKEESLCYAVLAEKNDYDLKETGFSQAASHLIGFYTMKNVLMKNKFGKVELNHLINLWRSELSSYKEGEIIDLENHRKNLIDFNMTMYPKIRNDLLEQRNSNLVKNIFQ